MRKRLFIPGPVDLRDEIREAMASPMIGHRSKDATELQKELTEGMQAMMGTQNAILFSTSSGTGLMEGAVRSCTRRRAAIFSIGAFGDRWYQICCANGVPADLFKAPLGEGISVDRLGKALQTGCYDLVTITHNETSTGVAQPLEPIAELLRRYPDVVWAVDAVSSLGGDRIDVDRLGIDICLTSSQKCLGLPPGLALASVSEKAISAAHEVPQRGLYFDYLELLEFIQKKPFQYPSTPSLAHYFALREQLRLIRQEGGFEARWQRHAELARRCQDWAEANFALFPSRALASRTVTCVRNTRGISVTELNRRLGERGFVISNGYGALKEKTFRIAHMADCQMEDLNALLRAMESCLADMKA